MSRMRVVFKSLHSRGDGRGGPTESGLLACNEHPCGQWLRGFGADDDDASRLTRRSDSTPEEADSVTLQQSLVGSTETT